jgi:hypothetical protein
MLANGQKYSGSPILIRPTHEEAVAFQQIANNKKQRVSAVWRQYAVAYRHILASEPMPFIQKMRVELTHIENRVAMAAKLRQIRADEAHRAKGYLLDIAPPRWRPPDFDARIYALALALRINTP